MRRAAQPLRAFRWAALAVATLALAACGGHERASTAPSGAESPQTLLVAFRQACIAADEAKIRGLVDPLNAKAAAEAVEFYAAESRKIRARNEAREAFLTKFGQTAWEVAPPGGGDSMQAWHAADLGGEWLQALAEANASPVKVEGDRATVAVGESTWDMKRKDGRWRLDPGPAACFRPEGAARRAADAKAATDQARRYKARVAESENFEEFAAKRDR